MSPAPQQRVIVNRNTSTSCRPGDLTEKTVQSSIQLCDSVFISNRTRKRVRNASDGVPGSARKVWNADLPRACY